MSAGAGQGRRQFLRIAAAAAALPLAVLGAQALRGAPEPVRWRGEALGAEAAITLWHADTRRARAALGRIEAELARLRRVFDLHDPQSEIARLNAQGTLASASGDLRAVLTHALEVAEASGGAFDPTIQPLWRALSDRPGDARAHAAARSLLAREAVEVGARRIRLGRPGMQITLNGIAQGHAADRLAAMLHAEGFETALIDAGEVRALGPGPDGAAHAVALIDPAAPTRTRGTMALRDSALAVSGGYGLRMPGGGHHIVDPATGTSAERVIEVVVEAPTAREADALSTALYVAGPERAGAILPRRAGVRARLMRTTGETIWLGDRTGRA
ncbi:MAG: FAD:protein FMN transferase [Alphaproteobacteria bacterium]|nr:FAD:protein FMN transferase [Alphaproteobacteria bacterium]